MQNHPNPFHHSNKSLLSRAREDHLTCSICLCKNGVAIVDPELDEPWVLTLKCTNDISHPNWSTCLFCGYRSSSLEKNLKHMTISHSFFLPDPEYITDLEGLIEYLGAKVNIKWQFYQIFPDISLQRFGEYL